MIKKIKPDKYAKKRLSRFMEIYNKINEIIEELNKLNKTRREVRRWNYQLKY